MGLRVEYFVVDETVYSGTYVLGRNDVELVWDVLITGENPRFGGKLGTINT